MYTGPGTWNDFLTDCMERLLHFHNMDPETDVYKIELKAKIIGRKRKRKGIYDEPSIIEAEPAKEVSEIVISEKECEETVSDICPADIIQLESYINQNVQQPRLSGLGGQSDTSGYDCSGIKSSVVRSSKRRIVPGLGVDEEKYCEVPAALASQLGDCVIQKNTGNDSSLFKAAKQHIKAEKFIASEEGFENLQRFVNSKLVEWWPNFEHFYSWPMEIKIGSDLCSKVICIQDAELFKTFLLSEESLHFANNPEVDLWILAYCLNTHIYVLSYDNKYKTRLDDTHMKTFAGTNVVLPTEFSINTSNLWLVTEDGLKFNRACTKREMSLMLKSDLRDEEDVERNTNVESNTIDGESDLNVEDIYSIETSDCNKKRKLILLKFWMKVRRRVKELLLQRRKSLRL